MTSRAWVRSVLIVLAVCAAGWGGGFAWFARMVDQPDRPPPEHADGIVALTGAAGRVDLALHLLATRRADHLLLSGIGGGTELPTLGRMAGVDTAKFAGAITLGRYAASTRGNAVETAAWAKQNSIASLIVVTSNYHMPRALAELHQTLPDIQLYPLPATSGRLGWRLEAEEYSKYLLTISGLSAWLPQRESVAVPPGGNG